MHNHRNLVFALAASLALAAASFPACSYDAAKADILLHVDNLPANAVRAEVTLTGGDAPVQYFPKFGAAAGAGQDFAFAAPKSGTYVVSVQVQAFDPQDNLIGDGTVATAGPVTFPAVPPVALQLSMATVAGDGSFAARCSADDAGTQSCGAGLVCLQYQGATSRGVCTQTCTGTCPSTPAPPAVCAASSSGNACQWECDLADGGTTPCPPGLTCQSQTSPATSKKFCQPPT